MRRPDVVLRDYTTWYGPALWPAYVASRLIGWPRTIAVRHRGLAHDVLMRPRTTDVKMYHSIFTQPQYDLPLAAAPLTIFDCGGNVGYAAVWFAMRYPQARIVSIEPDRDNYALLVRNTSPFRNVMPIHAAVWGSDTALDVVDIGHGECSFETRPVGEGPRTSVVGRSLALSLPTLMRMLDVTSIDLLKMDVEGAETQVLAGDLAWLRCVGVVVIEFHDERCPGLRERFRSMATQFFTHHGRLGENEVFARPPFVGGESASQFWSRL